MPEKNQSEIVVKGFDCRREEQVHFIERNEVQVDELRKELYGKGEDKDIRK